MKISPARHAVGAVMTGYDSVNNLGVLRNLARSGVPVTLLVPHPRTMAGWSRFPTQKASCPDVNLSPEDFLEFLLSLETGGTGKPFLIPTGDAEALLMSKHRDALRDRYLVTVPPLEVTETLVNKRMFYRYLESMSVHHPTTHYPDGPSAWQPIADEIAYPYLLKPIYSHLFWPEFNSKNLPIFGTADRANAVAALTGAQVEVMVQEVVPGDEIYMCALCMDKDSAPIAICGYDKIRQYVPDFGDGSQCRSRWRAGPIETAVEVLRAIKYRGIAEAEFKWDPRDGTYKLLEINARTTTQSALAAACGTNLEYLAYRDAIGTPTARPTPAEGVVWIHEFRDPRSWIPQWAAGRLRLGQVLRSMQGKRVYAVAAWDDPLPFVIGVIRQVSQLARAVAKRLMRQPRLPSAAAGPH